MFTVIDVFEMFLFLGAAWALCLPRVEATSCFSVRKTFTGFSRPKNVYSRKILAYAKAHTRSWLKVN